MMRQLDCTYVFEWPTPLVCPETISAQGCKLRVSQLQYTFDLSVLSRDVQVTDCAMFILYANAFSFI